MAKLFQIDEHDLAGLEEAVPFLSHSLMQHLGHEERIMLKRCKEILSNVRWHYGPATEVEVIPVDPEE